MDGAAIGDTIAHVPACDTLPYGHDRSGSLVAHDDGRNAAAGAAVHTIYVAAADTGSSHLHQYLGRSNCRFRHIGVEQVIVVLQ